MDQLRTVAQVENDDSKSELQLFNEILQRDGVVGLYKGFSSVLCTLSISNFVYFYFYNGLKIFAVGKNGKEISAKNNLLIAALAGSINVLITCPLWVAATRLKLQQKNKLISEEMEAPYDGLFATTARIAKEEGVCVYMILVLAVD